MVHGSYHSAHHGFGLVDIPLQIWDERESLTTSGRSKATPGIIILAAIFFALNQNVEIFSKVVLIWSNILTNGIQSKCCCFAVFCLYLIIYINIIL
ncbi:hypothetical protein I3760_07G005000 [Carya illinoinensis]|nr:hypothetical protein I3760_07G005000 [Carya illinoinensis]